MNSLTTTLFIALLALAAATVPAAPQVDDSLSAVMRQKGPCAKVMFSRSIDSTVCKRGKRLNVIRMDVKLGVVDLGLRVTLRCISKGRAKNVSKRIIKCAKLLLKRCRCVTDIRKDFCVKQQVNTCSQQFLFEVLASPSPSAVGTM